ncbi:hypothetical protein AMECASPLE_007718 [Ameca splendens]|uniref:Uncharacterized protein n=1 Tax=Ameca splendens TaxID=208324 RepID=A0ABV0ZAU9_9TELE
MVFHGCMWSEERGKSHFEIGSEKRGSQLLENTHKNYEVFKLTSGKMEAVGFICTLEQCFTKVIICGTLRTSGSSGEEDDKLHWYEELDAILFIFSHITGEEVHFTNCVVKAKTDLEMCNLSVVISILVT